MPWFSQVGSLQKTRRPGSVRLRGARRGREGEARRGEGAGKGGGSDNNSGQMRCRAQLPIGGALRCGALRHALSLEEVGGQGEGARARERLSGDQALLLGDGAVGTKHQAACRGLQGVGRGRAACVGARENLELARVEGTSRPAPLLDQPLHAP